MTLHFDIRDLFRCVRLGWSGKKIWIGLLGLIAAWAGYSILLIIAHLSKGASLGALWQDYGLFPGARLGDFDLLGTALHLLGMLFVLAVVFVTTSMMCKITFQHLRGDDFYSIGDAWQFAKANGKAVLFGPLTLLFLFAMFVIGGMVIGALAGWIPVAGELIFALCFIPIFFVALLAVFTGIVFVVASILSPAMVGTVEDDTLEVAIQSFSLTWSQPWRLVLYLAWIVVSTWIGMMLLGVLTLAAVGLIVWACGFFMGIKLAHLFYEASHYLLFQPANWDQLLANLPALGTMSGAEVWSGGILGVMLVLVTGIVLAYVQATYASGLCLMYVALRHRKDHANLLKWDDEEETDEEESDHNTDSETA